MLGFVFAPRSNRRWSTFFSRRSTGDRELSTGDRQLFERTVAALTIDNWADTEL